MKRLLSVLLLVVFTGIFRSTAQIASFGFGTATDVSGWTRLAGNPVNGAQTATMNGISISSIAARNWAPDGIPSNETNDNGLAPTTYFPTTIMAGDWFQYNGSTYNLALYNASVPQLQLSGLNRDSTYTLRMSSTCIYNRGQTQYTVAGKSVSGSQLLTTYNNISQDILIHTAGSPIEFK